MKINSRLRRNRFTNVFIKCIHLVARKWLYRADSLPANYVYKNSIEPWHEVWITLPNQSRVHGVYKPPTSSKVTIIFFHGNVGNVFDWGACKHELLETLGTGCLIIDYPGYGKSLGTPCEESIYCAAQGAINWLRFECSTPADRVVAYGYSLGGGVASKVAVDNQVKGLILESTFTSLSDVIRDNFNKLPLNWFREFDSYPTLKRINRINCPILLIHGTEDGLIPIKHALDNYSAAINGARLYSVVGAGHDNLPVVGGKEYVAVIKNWIASLVDNSSKELFVEKFVTEKSMK